MKKITQLRFMNLHKFRWRKTMLLLLLFDIAFINISMLLSILLRYDFRYSLIPKELLYGLLRRTYFYTPLCIIVFSHFKLYNRVWRYVGLDLIYSGVGANLVCYVIYGIICFIDPLPLPVIFYILSAGFQVMTTVGMRISFRVYSELRTSRHRDVGDRVMIIGGGEAGLAIIRELQRSSDSTDKPVCIIDDNKNIWGKYLNDVPIEGGRESILAAVEKYRVDKIIFAIPSATPEQRRDILSICTETDCVLRQIPSIYSNKTPISVVSVKNISIEDLLGRAPIKVNMTEVFAFIEGKCILVTGGGGSIGSELCRQIAAHHPKRLIIFDVYENNAYDIQLELKKKYPYLDLVTLIGSVRDSERIESVFDEYRPDIVFHAAAHKHVPLMEDSPCEAIKNNVFGTYKTGYAAMKYGCSRFVLISTDKAVNPTNMMGASKRLCEMVVQSFDKMIKAGCCGRIPFISYHGGANKLPENVKTEFVAVRFGNVLGSNGSVVPIFKRQIENGEDLTVTHPDIIRYFMTIKEAVSLVLQAGTYAHGGEIFVLDMGSPIKIDTLARNMVKLAGLRPDVDVKIVYTGLRPGEKLFEEKLMAEEGLEKTDNKLIFIGHPLDFDAETLYKQLKGLINTAYENRDDLIVDEVKRIVTTYKTN